MRAFIGCAGLSSSEFVEHAPIHAERFSALRFVGIESRVFVAGLWQEESAGINRAIRDYAVRIYQRAC